MPTYEYRCAGCGHAFERFQQMADEPVKKCPECGGPVTRLIGPGAGVILKGGRPAPAGPACCGTATPCDTPKRCCGQEG